MYCRVDFNLLGKIFADANSSQYFSLTANKEANVFWGLLMFESALIILQKLSRTWLWRMAKKGII